MQAEERAVQHQHEAVEDEARAERRQGAGDDRRLGRVPLTALVEDADDRLGEHRADDGGRREQERDLAEAARHLLGEGGQVAA